MPGTHKAVEATVFRYAPYRTSLYRWMKIIVRILLVVILPVLTFGKEYCIETFCFELDNSMPWRDTESDERTPEGWLIFRHQDKKISISIQKGHEWQVDFESESAWKLYEEELKKEGVVITKIRNSQVSGIKAREVFMKQQNESVFFRAYFLSTHGIPLRIRIGSIREETLQDPDIIKFLEAVFASKNESKN